MSAHAQATRVRQARVVDVYFAVLEWAVIAAIASMTVIAGLQVFFRYVLSDSLFWSEEVMRYIMAWTAFLSAGMAYSRGDMLGMRFLVEAIPASLRRVVDWISRLVMVVLLCVIAWYGFDFAIRTRFEEATALEISMLWIHLSVPVGAVLLAIHVLFTGYFRSVLIERQLRTDPPLATDDSAAKDGI